MMWDSRRSLTPSQVADSVLLNHAGTLCVGSARDESLVEAVAKTLAATRQRGWRTNHGEALEPSAYIASLLERQAGAGRSQTIDVEGVPEELLQADTIAKRRAVLRDRHASSVPSALPSVMREAIRPATNPDGTVRSLPVDVVHLHSIQKGHTQSVLKGKQKRWLDSEAGAAWAKKRWLDSEGDDVPKKAKKCR